MTVVSAMKFNPQEGAVVADEQSSNNQRKDTLSTKIHEFNLDDGFSIIGGSGTTSILKKIMTELDVNKLQEKTTKHLVQALCYITTAVKNDYLNSYLQSTYGISLKEFQIGKVATSEGAAPINPAIMERYVGITQGNGEVAKFLIGNSFLILNYNEKGINLKVLEAGLGKELEATKPFAPIGSGSDMAEDELTSYVERMTRNERENINPIYGLAALLYATNRATNRNMGVGGIPLIKVVKEGEIIEPSENNSKLASEIVLGRRAGYLPKRFHDRALDALVYNEGDFKAWNERMKKATGKRREEFDLFLRDYRV